MCVVLAGLPPPAAAIPHRPVAIVATLERTSRELDSAIEHWNKSGQPPRDVTLFALYQQRVIRLLANNARLARPVLERDPAVRDDVVALRELGRLAAPPSGSGTLLQTGPAAPAKRLLGWHREAQRRFGVRWQLLAAINFVESAFNKVRNPTGIGAQGPMQFEPAMWHAYGLGGNVDDPHDAIIGAANYLAANRGAKDERNALAHYTPRLSTATPFSATQTGSRAIATRSTSTTAGRSTSGHEAEPTDSPDLADSSPPPTARARM
jgi:hypothetical protein